MKNCNGTHESRRTGDRRARARAFRFWQGCARCARWCTVRAVARVRGACVVGARWCGARCVRFVWHARTLATVPTLLARVPACVAARRFRVARRWCAHARRCVGAVRVARRCVPFLRVVASLWLTVRRCGVYGAVVVSVSPHGTSNPGHPHGARWRRFTRTRIAVAPSRGCRRFRRWCVVADPFQWFLDVVSDHQQRRMQGTVVAR